MGLMATTVPALLSIFAASSLASVVSQASGCDSGVPATLAPGAVRYIAPDGEARSVAVEVPRLADAATVTFDNDSPRVAFHSSAVRHACILSALMSLLAAYLAAHQ
jgi:hypothetical protein